MEVFQLIQQANTRPKRKTKDRSVKKTTSFKPRKGDAKAPVEQPARRIVRTSKKTMGDVANDDELKALISAGTDSESYDRESPSPSPNTKRGSERLLMQSSRHLRI